MKKLLPLAALLIIAGCQDTTNTINSQEPMNVQGVKTDQVITDSFLKGRLKVMRVNKGYTPAGLLKVQVALRNDRTGVFSEWWSSYTKENPYTIAYKFTWLDENGMMVNNNTGNWLFANIIPGDTLYLQAVAPNERCKNFSLSLKEHDWKENF
tara:strand:+ start:89 stop:547 length:459 start_codon:yes stop_codon:yes gene_type:complete